MMIFKDIYVHFSNEICVCLELLMFIIHCTLCKICDMRSSVYMYTSSIRVVINEVLGYLGELAIVVVRVQSCITFGRIIRHRSSSVYPSRVDKLCLCDKKSTLIVVSYCLCSVFVSIVYTYHSILT
jgi:hypothetical protein